MNKGQIDQNSPVAVDELGFRQALRQPGEGETDNFLAPCKVQAGMPPAGLGVPDVSEGDAELTRIGGEEKLIAASCAPLRLLIAVQQGLPQLLHIQRLGQVALGVYVIAQQGHIPVGGDEYNVRGIGLLLQMAGQRHAVQRIHDHIQEQKIEMPAPLNFAQKGHAAAVGGDSAGNVRLLQDVLGELNGLAQVGLLIVTDGDLIHMATVEKIRKDIEKTKEKISAQQKRLRELEAQLTEEENLEIVRMVKAVRMDNKELTAFLKAYASGLITLPDGMMEAEAAADPDDEDMEGMEDGEDEA